MSRGALIGWGVFLGALLTCIAEPGLGYCLWFLALPPGRPGCWFALRCGRTAAGWAKPEQLYWQWLPRSCFWEGAMSVWSICSPSWGLGIQPVGFFLSLWGSALLCCQPFPYMVANPGFKDPRRDNRVQVSFWSLFPRQSCIICCELISVVLGNLLKQLLWKNYSEEIFWCGRPYSCIRV